MTTSPEPEDRGRGEVLLVLPVLRRVHRLEPVARSIREATPEPHRILFVASAHDTPVIRELRRLERILPIEVLVMPRRNVGDYAAKCNAGAATGPEPFVFCGADDLAFHAGWWPAVRAAFEDPAIGVVGTQDLANPRTIAGEHSTHLVFRRTYVDELGTIDEPGKLFHEGYPHEYVDDEAVETAKHRGAWAFAHGAVVEHLHPMVGKAPPDDLYRAQARRMAVGRGVFARRRALWSDPPPLPTPENVSIVVGTFGDDRWSELARARAIPSADAQHPLEVIHVHGSTLADARNRGAEQASGAWLVFLDADDELAPGYLSAIADCAAGRDRRAPAVFAPAAQYVDGDTEADPVTFEDRHPNRLNPCVIGTAVSRELFYDVGGFWPERAWEDWSLFRRCWLAGAKIVHVPAAVYRVHASPDGRNSTVTNPAALHRQIIGAHSQWLRRRKARQ